MQDLLLMTFTTWLWFFYEHRRALCCVASCSSCIFEWNYYRARLDQDDDDDERWCVYLWCGEHSISQWTFLWTCVRCYFFLLLYSTGILQGDERNSLHDSCFIFFLIISFFFLNKYTVLPSKMGFACSFSRCWVYYIELQFIKNPLTHNDVNNAILFMNSVCSFFSTMIFNIFFNCSQFSPFKHRLWLPI